MKKTLFIILITLFSMRLNAQIKIIPQPVEIEIKKGFFVFDNKLIIYNTANDSSVNSIAVYLKETLINKGKVADIQIVNGAAKIKKGLFLFINKNLRNLGDEGYELNITQSSIDITASNIRGLFYGVQSLRQLLPAEFESKTGMTKPGFKIPCVEITDNPKFKWRGMLLDCGRHFMDKEFVKRYIDLLAYYKMNTLHWHLTEDQGWRIEIKKYPKLTEIGSWRTEADGSRYGGFYSQDEIKEVVEYAKERFVNVVPEIELPGHSVAAIASYPNLSCTGKQIDVETQWGVFKDIYCAGNDTTINFLKDVLTEVMSLFPSKYIHIGGDEAPKYRWENCTKCQSRIKNNVLKDEHELQSWFIGQFDEFLSQNGRKLIGWDEILEGGLSKGATVQSWRGMEGAIAAARSGHDAIVSPTSHAYFDYDISNINLEKVFSFDPIPDELNENERKHILGGECNLWSERAPQEKVDGRMFPRILAMSEVLWTYPEKRNFNEFRKRVQLQYPVLKALGVTYGFEREPLKFTANTDISKKLILVNLEKGQEGTDIFYTTSGIKPDRKALKYSKAIVAKDSLKLKVAVLANDNDNGFYYERSFKMSKSTALIPKLKFPYSQNYKANGDNALTDGVLGTENFRDGNWQGYEGVDMIAVIDLGKETEISTISTGFLQSTPSWIFFPPQLEYFISKDGVEFRSIGVLTAPVSPKDVDNLVKYYTINLPIKAKTQFVKVVAKNMVSCPEWHPGAGGKAWIFADEIIIE